MSDDPKGVIATGSEGQAQSFTGRPAVEVYRLATLASGLRMEIRCPGLKMSRHGSALKFAKGITGLKTNDRAKQLVRVEEMLIHAKAQCEYVGPE